MAQQHPDRADLASEELATLAPCLCGCGELAHLVDRKGRKRSGYVQGHNRRRSITITNEDRGHATPCHVWPLSKSKGYGQTRDRSGMRSAHRVAYERAYGPIPPGRHLHHLCHQRDCVNPEHLELMDRHLHNREHRATHLTPTLAEEIKARAAARAGNRFAKAKAIAAALDLPVSPVKDVLYGKSWA